MLEVEVERNCELEMSWVTGVVSELQRLERR